MGILVGGGKLLRLGKRLGIGTGKFAARILDGLAGPTRIDEEGNETKGFFRSRTNIAATGTAVVTFANLVGWEIAPDIAMYIANGLGFLLIALFKHISKTPTRIVS